MANIVFSTQACRPWITEICEAELRADHGGIARNIDATALAVGGVADHVHLLVRYPPRISVLDLTRTLEVEFIRLGPRTLAKNVIPMATGLRRVFGQRVEQRQGHHLHTQPSRASSQAEVSGRIAWTVGKAWHRV